MDEFSGQQVEAGETAPELEIEKEKSANRAARIVFLVVFIDLFGFGIVLPLLPRYGKDFVPGGENSPWSGIILGSLAASFSAMQFFFAPIWGRISDRVGRRPILLMGLASSVVFYSLFGVASLLGYEGARQVGLILLFVSRLGAGIAGATLGTAQAAIADSTGPKHRARGMALIGAAFGIGFFFGPLLGFGALAIAPDFPGGPGFLAAGLSLLAFLLGVAFLPETRRPGVSAARRTWLDVHGLSAALRAPTIGTLIITFFLSTLAFANFEPTLALVTTTKALGLSDKNNFLVFAYVGLILALIQGGVYRPLARRVSETAFMCLGAVLMALGLAGVGVIAFLAEQPDPGSAVSLLTGLLVILAIAITGFAFVTPSIQSLISRLTDPSKQGEILGVNQSASAMARILGPAAGMPLYFLSRTHFGPYAFGTALLIVVLIFSLRIRRELRVRAF